ncbi:EpsG family protein [[Clostridium] symbiosum]|uniref:EpsG family protein n=2 Tax=Clostridium symbiosum TaxID=1512 RepID=UPI003001A4F4
MYNWFFICYFLIMMLSWFFCFFENKLTKRTKKILILFFILILSSLMAIRPETVADTGNYIKIYNQVSELDMNEFHFGKRFEGIEYAFAWIMKGFSYFFATPRAFFFVCAISTSMLLMYGFCSCEKYINPEKEPHIFPTWTLFLCYFGLHYCGIAIRGGVSIGLGMCAMAYALHKKKVRAFVFFVASICIHSISILFLVIYIIIFIFPRVGKEYYILIWNLLFLCLFFNIGKIGISSGSEILLSLFLRIGIQGFDGYLSRMDFNVGITDWYMLCVTGLILLCGFRKNEHAAQFQKVVLVGLIIISVAYPIRAINRAYDYFLFFLVPLIASCFAIEGHEKKKVLLWLYMPLMFVVQFKMCYF